MVHRPWWWSWATPVQLPVWVMAVLSTPAGVGGGSCTITGTFACGSGSGRAYIHAGGGGWWWW